MCVHTMFLLFLFKPCWRTLRLAKGNYIEKEERILFCHTTPLRPQTHTCQVITFILINHANADCVGLDFSLQCIFRLRQSPCTRDHWRPQPTPTVQTNLANMPLHFCINCTSLDSPYARHAPFSHQTPRIQVTFKCISVAIPQSHASHHYLRLHAVGGCWEMLSLTKVTGLAWLV